MDLYYIILAVVAAYITGSIPSAVWYGKAFNGIDVRDYGSGNAGATNTFRVLGKKAGIIVMLVDIIKGYIASMFVIPLKIAGAISIESLILFQLLLGISAAIGHIFPIFAGFRGGKAVATLFGMILAIHIEASLVCMAVFFIVFIASKYVSLSSIAAAITFSVLMMMPRFSDHDPVLIVLGIASTCIVLYTHKKNIKRLINGDESKIKISLRKK
ncbi:glycerol-3-phosphate 1-O-acyltransferase PlsY [Cytophagaceae bacterium ABcell3]|nr:glycerol-3-phosphate 1-O-acyltransferase PlsY [Cytophagaceae bacterium ABcell3]